MRTDYKKTFRTLLSAILTLTMFTNIAAQEKDYSKIEEKQDKREATIEEIHGIVKDYPEFTYTYQYTDDGMVKKVIVEGVDDEEKVKELEVLLTDLSKCRSDIKNQPNRCGIFYVTDEEAKPKSGFDEYYDKLYDNLKFPETAENKGVEGTVYVKFVIDQNGNISNIKADSDIETPYKMAVDQLEEEAKKSVKNTGDWEPAKVGGVPVHEYVVIPVQFDFQRNPALRNTVR
jgi:TonB family protein